MNDLVLSAGMAQAFPTIAAGLRKAQSVFDSIKSFEDIERVFLKGAGLSANTYRSYLSSVRAFYTFTGGKHPLTVVPSDIESWYDDLARRVDRNTAALRVCGLKKFFAGIRGVLPIYTSPFEIMCSSLHAKLNRVKKSGRTKKALTAEEIKRILAWSESEYPETRAAFYMLVGSGLRASELLQLRWRDLCFHEGKWTAVFIGKGAVESEQELFPPAIENLRTLRHSTPPEAPLFPWSYHRLWANMKAMGKAAREEGILCRELQFTPHLCRRSYATCLDRLGMDLKSIQVLTRHASIEVLAKHYIDRSEPASPLLMEAFA
jgi:integrase